MAQTLARSLVAPTQQRMNPFQKQAQRAEREEQDCTGDSNTDSKDCGYGLWLFFDFDYRTDFYSLGVSFYEYAIQKKILSNC